MAIIILIPLLPSFCKRQGHDTFFFLALLERKWNSFGKTNDKAPTTRAISERSFICILLRDRRKHIYLLLLLVLSKDCVRLVLNVIQVKSSQKVFYLKYLNLHKISQRFCVFGTTRKMHFFLNFCFFSLHNSKWIFINKRYRSSINYVSFEIL